ncbi:MAG TPA: hypothetical protein VK668_18355 [Mucilaginibacter sp.]|nr:hypothetical protein [Mucilaginibacter sp.]
MIKSLLTKTGNAFIILSIIAVIMFSYGFRSGMDEQEWLTWSNKCLSESYDPSVDVKLKKWEIEVTPDHFLRLRKTYQHDRQEYFSLSLQKFDGLEYHHSAGLTDTLQIKTNADDIIVQTYNDPKGDLDSMATILDIPVKNMASERLDSLRSALLFFKSKGL